MCVCGAWVKRTYRESCTLTAFFCFTEVWLTHSAVFISARLNPFYVSSLLATSALTPSCSHHRPSSSRTETDPCLHSLTPHWPRRPARPFCVCALTASLPGVALQGVS